MEAEGDEEGGGVLGQKEGKWDEFGMHLPVWSWRIGIIGAGGVNVGTDWVYVGVDVCAEVWVDIGADIGTDDSGGDGESNDIIASERMILVYCCVRVCVCLCLCV